MRIGRFKYKTLHSLSTRWRRMGGGGFGPGRLQSQIQTTKQKKCVGLNLANPVVQNPPSLISFFFCLVQRFLVLELNPLNSSETRSGSKAFSASCFLMITRVPHGWNCSAMVWLLLTLLLLFTFLLRNSCKVKNQNQAMQKSFNGQVGTITSY